MELLIATFGLFLGAVSFGWQLATHFLTGGRVKVTLEVGAASDDGGSMITAPPGDVTPAGLADLAQRGFTRQVVALTAVNVGRLPVTVTRWRLRSPAGTWLQPAAGSGGPALPHRLDVGDPATWTVPLDRVETFGKAAAQLPGRSTRRGLVDRIQARQAGYDLDGIVGVVSLADGRATASGNVLPVVS